MAKHIDRICAVIAALAVLLTALLLVCAPLCSYVWVTVNGADWGLYLAV